MAQFDFDAHASAAELGRSGRVDTTWTFDGTTISLQATGLPFHSLGNPNAVTPVAQNFDIQLVYRGGTNEEGIHSPLNTGPIGWWLNGVAIFGPSAAGQAPTNYTAVKGYNFNTSYKGELSLGYTYFDDLAGAHAVSGGAYNYHNFNFKNAWLNGKGASDGSKGIADASIISYLAGSLTHDDGHSKILGWALDGFPIYGPYGYSTATDSESSIKRMESCYILKGASYRTGNATNTTMYPMGIFVEDYQFTSAGDLDKYNGRYCVTPDFPNGTYAYFVSVDSQDNPVYPYVIGNSYYGTPTLQTNPGKLPMDLVTAELGAPVSEKATSVAAAAVLNTRTENAVPDVITWVTKKGDLGTFAENSELSISLVAKNPIEDDVPAAGFDPRLSIVGNGNGTTEVTVPVTKNKLIIKYAPGMIVNKDHPDPLGEVLVGDFPNSFNRAGIKATAYELTYPYRGGRNEAAVNSFPAGKGQIGISAAGVPLFGYIGQFVFGENDSVWEVNEAFASVEGRDDYGGYPDRFGAYRYQDSKFITKNAWARIKKFNTGYRYTDGHSKLIGWAADGYPIYGPYGYVNPKDVGSVKLMVSGWSLKRINTNRPRAITAVVTRGSKKSNTITLNIATGIHAGMRIGGGSWPADSVWVESVSGYTITLNKQETIEANQFISAYWPVGSLVQDWEYSAPAGTTLDRHNGRFCITPDFPGGTYAYFATQDANGTSTFPYLVGPDFKGSTEIQDPPIPGVADLSGTKKVSGLTYTVVAGALPPGTQLYKTSGIIYGNPIVTDAKTNVPRKYQFTVRATNTRGKIADRAFTISVNNILPPTLNDAVDPTTNTVDLGTFFDSELLSLQLAYTEANPGATMNWSVSRGTIPLGLTLTQTGTITGFALAPRAAGATGTGAYDQGVFDQFVYDYEGATLTRTYKFTIRLYDGVNIAERKYQMTILAKSFFRADNNLLTADSDDVTDQSIVTEKTIFRADKDGFVYPTVITDPATVPTVRQDRAFAFKFDAYYPNPNYKIRYVISNSDADVFGETPFDGVGFDSATLSLPPGLSLDETTGWLTGTLGLINSTKQFYDFQIRAYVEVPININEVDRRFSGSVQFRLRVLSAAQNLINWSTPADLGYIDNGRISTLTLEAVADDGQAITYSLKSTMKALISADPDDQRIVSGVPSRLPQGLSLLQSGLISGRTTFDYYSMDRNAQAEIFLDKKSTTFDAIYTFVVEARTVDGISFSDQTFTLRVRHINKRPFENLYMRSLNSPDLRSLFHSVLDDVDLTDLVYRADDPWFGIPKTLSFLAVPGLKADTPANYIEAMGQFHMNKEINFGDLKTAVASDYNLNPIYEVLYVEVKEPGNPTTNSEAINRVYTDITDVQQTLTVESNTLENMKAQMVGQIGYEYQGALPDWMISLQDDTQKSIGFVRAVVLGYTMPGKVRKLKAAFLRSLLRGSYGFSTIFNQFKFVADRYQWDRALSTSYQADVKKFNPSTETTFDISAPLEVIDKGPWLTKNTQVSADLNSIAYGDSGFVAVGKNNTLITSKRGDRWDTVTSSVDLSYAVAVKENVPIGSSVLPLHRGVVYSVGDEVIQQDPWLSEQRAYITDVEYTATIGNIITSVWAVSNVIPAGTYLEFIDLYGAATDVVLTSSAAIHAQTLSVSAAISSLQAGQTVTIKGIESRVIANIASIDATGITLGDTTTNVIAAGTTILLDDQTGNVFAFTTANVTDVGVSTIWTDEDPTASITGDATVFNPSIAGLYGMLQDVGVNVTVSSTNINSIQKDSELHFAIRINQASTAGTSRIYLSNTDRIAVRSAVTSSPLTAGSFAAGGWTSNSAATISTLRATIPTAALQGKVITNMEVLGPNLPQKTKVVQTFVRGSLTYIDLSFPVPQTGLYTLGSQVTTNGYYSLTLDTPLAYPLEKGSELVFNDFSGDLATLTMEIPAAAGTSVIEFNTPPGRSVLNHNIKVKGFRGDSALVANAAVWDYNSVAINYANIEFNIPFNTTINFQDSYGNTQYVTSTTAYQTNGNIAFTTNVLPTLIGTTVSILGLDAETGISSVSTGSNVIVIDTPTTHVIGAGANITIVENANVSYVFADHDVPAGSSTITLTTVPEVYWAGNSALTLNGIEVGTLVSTTTAGNIILDGDSNATIVANTRIKLDDGFGNLVFTVANATSTSTRIPLTTAPARTLEGSTITIVGIPGGTTIDSADGNTIVLSSRTTAAIPQFTYIEVSDNNGHVANLQVATEYAANVDTVLLTTPAVTSLAGSYVPINGNAILSFSSVGVVDTGTTVISKTSSYITLNKPLVSNVEIGFDDSVSYGVSSADYTQARWLNNRWVVVGTKAMVLSQDENGNWDQRFAYQYGDLTAVGYGGGIYVAVGSAGLILTSEDLEAWEIQSTNTSETHRSVTFHNGTWYIVSDRGIVQSSTDTVTWNDITVDVWGSATRHGLRVVRYFNGLWVMAGESGTVIVSPDNGVTWNKYNTGTTSVLNDILFTAGLLVAVGNNGVIVESKDGTSWSPRTSGIALNLNSVTTDGAVTLAAGANGLVLASSGFYVVDFAVRNISFEMFNNNSVDVLASKGYRVQDGQTCIWAQQEGFSSDQYRGAIFENDGWNNYESTFDHPNFDSLSYDTKLTTSVLTTAPLPGSANIIIASMTGVASGDYVTVGSYQLSAGVRVVDVWPLQNMVTLDRAIVATAGEQMSFYNPVGYDTKSYVPGFEDHARDLNIINQRAGIWRITVDETNIVTLNFIRPVDVGQLVMVKRENTKLIYDQNLAGTQTVPAYNIVRQELSRPAKTTFDGSGTKFSNNRDQYTEPGALDKYLKFPRIGVFE